MLMFLYIGLPSASAAYPREMAQKGVIFRAWLDS